MNSVKNQIIDQARYPVWNQVDYLVYYLVWNQVYDHNQIWELIMRRVRNQIWNTINELS